MDNELDLLFTYDKNGIRARSDLLSVDDVKKVVQKQKTKDIVHIYVKFANNHEFYLFEDFVNYYVNKHDVFDIIKKATMINKRRLIFEDILKRNPLLDESDFSETVEKILRKRENAEKQIRIEINCGKESLKNEKQEIICNEFIPDESVDNTIVCLHDILSDKICSDSFALLKKICRAKTKYSQESLSLILLYLKLYSQKKEEIVEYRVYKDYLINEISKKRENTDVPDFLDEHSFYFNFYYNRCSNDLNYKKGSEHDILVDLLRIAKRHEDKM